MNPRIKQLCDLARFSEEVPYPHEDEIFEKFAQLIVRDVISKIALIGVVNFENDDISWTVEKAIETIECHFGVQK